MPAPSSSSASLATDYATFPLTTRNGRSFLRDPDSHYPFPCDLTEIHRQSLRTLSLINVWGGPVCAPYFNDNPPKHVLDVGCGSGLWSQACHEYFAKRGHPDVSFTGLDIIQIAPDLTKQGVNWQFKRHDLRKGRLPFPDASFDLIFIKDAGICSCGTDPLAHEPLVEYIRVLKPGGVIEVWDSDLAFRTLLPNPPNAPGLSKEEHQQANVTATYPISSATPFTDAQNRYLRDYNTWLEKAFEPHKINAIPCSAISLAFSAEAEIFQSMGSRRVAIPLGEVKWEAKQHGGMPLTQDQLALRQTTLLTTIQMIESMETMLMEASGKGKAEWDRWWTNMTADLMQHGGVSSGECLETGAWWAQKRQLL